MVYHAHKYKLDSAMTKGHNHRLLGYTDCSIGLNFLHFHFFYGVCSYNDHTHYYSGFTGIPIKTENGHIHKIEGILQTNIHHKHPFSSYTFENIEYTGLMRCKRWASN